MKILKYLFFLGGYDAEMCEIRKILEAHNQDFHDKKLSWGAKASAYQTELWESKNALPVLIELVLDIELPENSVIIDHHNENAGLNKPTSIEQIASLLNIKLNYWQELIAANDRGWIDELIKKGASYDEIKEIRAYDRKCQGVTEIEEKEAEIAISKLKKYDNLVVIHFPYERTSPISDRLHDKFKNQLIFTPKSTNFSGEGKIINHLISHYPDCWYGGQLPEIGFWGIPFQSIEIENIIISFQKEKKND